MLLCRASPSIAADRICCVEAAPDAGSVLIGVGRPLLLATITVNATNETAGENDMTLHTAILLANDEVEMRPEWQAHVSGALIGPGILGGHD